MSLAERLSRQVPGEIRQRGRAYYAEGAVDLVDADDRSVRAEVQGSDLYQVALALHKKKLRVWCSCPYFDQNFLTCKHIWATVLAADAARSLRAADAVANLRLEEDDDLAGDWDGDDGSDVEDDDWEDYAEPEPVVPFRPPLRTAGPRQAGRKKGPASWKKQLAALQGATPAHNLYGAPQANAWHAGREVLYVVDVPASLADQGGLVLEVAARERKRDGEWGKPKASRIGLSQIPQLPDPADRQILACLAGAREQGGYYGGYSYYQDAACRYALSRPMQDALMPLVCRTGRCRLRGSREDDELRPLGWDDAGPWEFWLDVTPADSGKDYVLAGSLRRDGQRLPLDKAVLLSGGLAVFEDHAARLEDFGASRWIALLRGPGPLTVPSREKDELLQELLKLPQLPRLDLPEELRFEEVRVAPGPRIKVKPPERRGWPGYDRLRGELSFDYDGVTVPADGGGRGVYQADRRRFLLRDAAAEADAAEKLRQLGFRPGHTYYNQKPELELAPRNLPRVVRSLLEAGWHVEAEGKLYRKPGELRVEVTSGIDWFELHGTVQFDDRQASLPELLAALKRGDNTVRLDDGTFGILPEEWLKKYGTLAGLGTAEGDHLRFTRAQVGLLDALLAAQPEATCDAVFARARDELRRFEGVEALDPPAGFVGQLRGYQRDGLGWLHFLQRFAFGGCLADDMGLGKTVQVLALLESRRERRAAATDGQRPAPSLVVVPRSLVFNWKQEAARFCPQLGVLDHTGIGRAEPGPHFQDYDVVLTTYGTLRRDILKLKDLTFDYCVLDEAQAVKNANTTTAKAVRLLRADHRLALSGTPVENHLGELWSLFEFLNPGMLGSASVFRLGGAGARNPDEETRLLLARALRPFILRRTKEQVAKDLPQKTEQTLYCELEPPQRKLYDELRRHYRQALLDRVARDGMGRSKIQILEALLRLRQAACHPGLIDKDRGDEASAKLDFLLPQLAEVLEEGHKVLVFSQFTSLLAIVRARLDEEGVPYEYLDGRTRNRQEKVERFQNDPACKLFLVSLKAGGLGLNLTAAEYVYLLDPWWNPAVEAQAIDRTHRIGQTKPVFAYRLIAKDTVEEKVLELQKTKRDLADAIINADNSLIRNLSQDDLQLLLS
jgi:superfamily II DNA or RNA helicase